MVEGFSAILLPQLQDAQSELIIDETTSAWIASLASLPMAPSCLLGGFLMEKIGRRNIHILACLPLIIGWGLIFIAPNANVILIGRFLGGVSDGLLGPPTGVYIAETAHPRIRGVLIMSTALAITAGSFLVHFLGTFMTWRTVALISGIIPIPFVILMFFLPESPTFLAKIGHTEEAKKAFLWCRGTSNESLKELEELIDRQRELNITSKMYKLKDLKKPEFWKPTVISSVLFFTSQLSGNNAFASYSIQILKECGLTNGIINEYFAMITMDIFKLIAAVISCFLIKTWTRRGLTLFSGFGVSFFLFSICMYLRVACMFDLNSSILLMLLLAFYVSFVCFGLVPVSWTMMGEIFPLAFRGLGTAISSTCCYIFLYLVVQTFPILLKLFNGILGVFLFYGICTLGGTLFLMLFLPETKDKPLYVIEDHFRKKKKNDQLVISVIKTDMKANI